MSNKKELALSGVKVADFCWTVVGPWITKYLAGFGATVVRIESHARPCVLRVCSPFRDGIPGLNRSAWFANWGSTKFSMSLNMSKPKALEIVWEMIEWADIVTNSFTPKVMEKWGLGYENIKKRKPEIIYLSTCMQGEYGPHALHPGFGHNLGALAGAHYLCGWPDRGPCFVRMAWTDAIAPRFAIAAILAALSYRNRTGRGVFIEQSQMETSLHFLAPIIMDYSINGRIKNRDGNHLSYAAPHGAYPCQGDDRWIAIAVFNDKEWQAFCNVLGNPEWTKDMKFATIKGRKENEAELDELVSRSTAGLDAWQLMKDMQKAGVAAGVVNKTSDLFTDEQLKYRGHVRYLNHREIGIHAYDGASFKLSRTPERQRAAPCLGQDNEYVYKEILGMSDDDISNLLAEGIITTEADFHPGGTVM